jgi:two-component sensor histidine kinase
VNAAKHGALSVPEGNVSISWALDGDGARPKLSLLWTEQHGPPVIHAKQAGGAGSSLIDHALPESKIEREFNASGLICKVELPLPR